LSNSTATPPAFLSLNTRLDDSSSHRSPCSAGVGYAGYGAGARTVLLLLPCSEHPSTGGSKKNPSRVKQEGQSLSFQVLRGPFRCMKCSTLGVTVVDARGEQGKENFLEKVMHYGMSTLLSACLRGSEYITMEKASQSKASSSAFLEHTPTVYPIFDLLQALIIILISQNTFHSQSPANVLCPPTAQRNPGANPEIYVSNLRASTYSFCLRPRAFSRMDCFLPGGGPRSANDNYWTDTTFEVHR
jgi:hypothetical protein